VRRVTVERAARAQRAVGEANDSEIEIEVGNFAKFWDLGAPSALRSAMSALTHWDPAAPFCPLCGSLLIFPDSGDVSCDICPFSRPLADFPHAPSSATSHPKPTPEWLLEWRAAAALRTGDAAGLAAEAARAAATGVKNAIVSEECPKCKAPQMEYCAASLRRALRYARSRTHSHPLPMLPPRALPAAPQGRCRRARPTRGRRSFTAA